MRTKANSIQISARGRNSRRKGSSAEGSPPRRLLGDQLHLPASVTVRLLRHDEDERAYHREER
jgi:hypothetical protein